MFNTKRPDYKKVSEWSQLKSQVVSESDKFNNMQLVMKLAKLFSWE